MGKVDFGSVGAGAASGAATGAMFGPWGAAIGGVGGGLLGLFSGKKKKAKNKQLSTKTKEQMELQKLVDEGLKNGTGPYKDLFGDFDKGAFEEGVSKPAMKKFQDETLPMLQEKFIANNQIMGSGAQNAQAKAGANLNAELAGLMYNAQNAQKQNRMQGINMLLGQQNFENTHQPAAKSASQGFIEGIAPGLGNAIGTNAVNQMSSWGKDNTKTPAPPTNAPVVG